MFIANSQDYTREPAEVPVQSAEVAPAEAPAVAQEQIVELPKTKAQIADDQRRADIDMDILDLMGDIKTGMEDTMKLMSDLREGVVEGKSNAKKALSGLRDTLFATAHRLKTAAGRVTAFGDEVMPMVKSKAAVGTPVSPEAIAAQIAALQAKLDALNAAGADAANAAIQNTEVPEV